MFYTFSACSIHLACQDLSMVVHVDLIHQFKTFLFIYFLWYINHGIIFIFYRPNGCFQCLRITNSTAVSILVHVSLCASVKVSSVDI